MASVLIQPTWTYLVPLAVAVVAFFGAVLGVFGQQAVDIWKTSRTHRQELQRRIFDAKFKAATELTVALYASARFIRARLAEAEEWSRGDNRYDMLALRQQTLESQGEALTRAFQESERAVGLMEFLFPPEISLYPHDENVLAGLEETWREYENRRVVFKQALDNMMPSQRAVELRAEFEGGQFSPQSQAEMQKWAEFYSANMANIRSLIPELRRLTDAYDVGTHKAIQLLRSEFSHYDH